MIRVKAPEEAHTITFGKVLSWPDGVTDRLWEVSDQLRCLKIDERELERAA